MSVTTPLDTHSDGLVPGHCQFSFAVDSAYSWSVVDLVVGDGVDARQAPTRDSCV